MLSDVQIAEQAEAELNGMNPGEISPDESPETPQVESDHQVIEPDVEPTKPQDEEVVELPEDHDPDATLADEPKEEKEEVPQFRTDAKNLAEGWDLLSEDEQSDKIERLKKSGRKSTITALATELGTTAKLLINPDDALVAKESEVDTLKAKLSELEGVMSYASRQAELDRYSTTLSKWADHNKLTDTETKELLSPDGELRKTFDKAQFNPETGEKLSLNGRLRLALNQTEAVQEMLVNKKAKKTAEEIGEGYKAAMPGTGAPGTTPSVSAKQESEMSPEEWLQYTDRQLGVRQW